MPLLRGISAIIRSTKRRLGAVKAPPRNSQKLCLHGVKALTTRLNRR